MAVRVNTDFLIAQIEASISDLAQPRFTTLGLDDEEVQVEFDLNRLWLVEQRNDGYDHVEV
jgi:hypothetical protein